MASSGSSWMRWVRSSPARGAKAPAGPEDGEETSGASNDDEDASAIGDVGAPPAPEPAAGESTSVVPRRSDGDWAAEDIPPPPAPPPPPPPPAADEVTVTLGQPTPSTGAEQGAPADGDEDFEVELLWPDEWADDEQPAAPIESAATEEEEEGVGEAAIGPPASNTTAWFDDEALDEPEPVSEPAPPELSQAPPEPASAGPSPVDEDEDEDDDEPADAGLGAGESLGERTEPIPLPIPPPPAAPVAAVGRSEPAIPPPPPAGAAPGLAGQLAEVLAAVAALSERVDALTGEMVSTRGSVAEVREALARAEASIADTQDAIVQTSDALAENKAAVSSMGSELRDNVQSELTRGREEQAGLLSGELAELRAAITGMLDERLSEVRRGAGESEELLFRLASRVDEVAGQLEGSDELTRAIGAAVADLVRQTGTVSNEVAKISSTTEETLGGVADEVAARIGGDLANQESIDAIVEVLADSVRVLRREVRAVGSAVAELQGDGEGLAGIRDEIMALKRRLPVRAKAASDDDQVNRIVDAITERLLRTFEVSAEPPPDPDAGRRRRR